MDKLIEEGLTTFDQAASDDLPAVRCHPSNDLPVIYAWADIAHQGLRKTVSTTAEGGLQLDTPQFAWQLEKLTNVKQ